MFSTTVEPTTPAGPPPGVPVLHTDPFGDDVLRDPAPFHHAMRQAGPVVYLGHLGVFGMARYAEVREALINWQDFPSSAGVGITNFRTEKPWRKPSLLLEADPPFHDAPRHVLSTLLLPRAIRAMQDGWRRVATQLVDDLLGASAPGRTVEIDAITDLARAFPLRVFPDAVGLGQDGRDNLLPYGDMLFNSFGPNNHLTRSSAERGAGIPAWVEAQCMRDRLRPGGFGAAIWAAADRGDITHDQAPLIVRSLLSAGVDTTVHGIGAVLAALAAFPDQWPLLRTDPTRARVAFDEAVRWASPVQVFFRTAERDTEIGGVTIPEGRKILMFLGSANHDPRRWPDPEVFDLGHDPSGHVGFGFGLHQCVGQHVARLEAESLLHALAARVETLEPAGEPVPHLNNTMHGWSSVPLRVTLR